MAHEELDTVTRARRSTTHTRSAAHGVLAGLGFAAAVAGAAAVGGLAMRGKGRPQGSWYRGLRKPSFQPPGWVFGPAWTVLYAAIAYSGWRVWKAPPSRERDRALRLWGLQLALNAAWTPLFFGARRPGIALVDIVALDVAASGYAVSARAVDRPAAIIAFPYLAWLGFATLLNATIAAKNR